ncbi:cyclic AMP-responsive element-binding protein 5-like isoform X1 [Solea senegalensis]|nr:cyclic AMP-responsive element-binding protein 5-like [Solea senegalensis]XP_043908923.1 cyclic AMP-responsive element-binding protein 5-like [Solea senegalensis]XP_043908924.1 cyclic AMP-responsive element-binding protein 5-like [Solea senegalensis]KAG7501036.1 cyclic AMP-responsive element-binding protein 5-like isoform X1 [Solea senegalensis]
MNDKQDRPYVCSAPGCSQRFQLEEHLLIHRHKHEMTLKFSSIKADTAFTDQTPTPTRFLQNCEEVGLFKEIEEEFLQAQEEEKSKQTLTHNGPSCMNQHQLKPQLHLQHPHPQPPLHHPQTHVLQRPQCHGPTLGPSCSLAGQQTLPCSSQSGSVITQAPSTLTHSGPVPGPLSSLLHMRNRHRQPLPASLPGTLPDPAMQGASAQHMTIEKQMSCLMGLPGPGHNPSCSSPQRSKQTLGHHFPQHHPGMVAGNNPGTSMGHMMDMMSQCHQAPPLQHHHHHPHHPQLPAPPLPYQQRCHAPPPPPPPPPQHLGSSHSHQLHQSGNVPHAQAHQSPPSHMHQASPPARPLSVPAQLSPVAQQMQPSQPSHSQHAMQGGSCSGGGPREGGCSGRRRRTAEQDPDERRQKFLERNRAAATRCRQKRKLWVSSLEKKAEELTHTNLQLQNEVTSLRSEVGQLKQILLTHKDCPVTARQREAQGYPTAGGSPTPVGPGSHLQAIQHNSISTSSTATGDTSHDPQPAGH